MEDKIEAVKAIVIDTQRDVATLKVKSDYFENNIDKLTDISSNITRLLAVHEQRLEAAEKVNRSLPDVIEQRRQEAQSQVVRVMDRINSVDTELRHEINNNQKQILDEIKSVHDGVTQLRIDMSAANSKLKTDLEDDFETKIQEMDKRITDINKWMWTMMGGIAVLGAILAAFNGLIHIHS